jgi:post-segregation antitoxin (ccd killing protein)
MPKRFALLVGIDVYLNDKSRKLTIKVSASGQDAISPELRDSSEDSAVAGDAAVARADLEKFQKAHEWDPNLPQKEIDAVKHALQSGDAVELVHADHVLGDDSPYEEVRAAVRNTDNDEVANTVRAWILGMIFVTIGSGLNMFLSMR